ncbi:SGNH/GDSL hydrolase family protein [Pseudomonas sp. BN415]|uniref:SGNH/GDSL hydrolase family protein n=1 Tax=Pseudomonas sp. BN415 TaxID=2567889 RepID=UPI002454FC55|nr:SGNH/GDSL hydrolase family protein [Pseudomonas sp. BN415]MDH4581115.1 SGNH/GDSL hydrolase family protein [Pseudomonas sp. BN415]
MIRLAGLCWWVAALPLLPLALPMAVHTRRTALRLAPAAGPESGLAGGGLEGAPLRLLLIGESTVAGVGASCLDFALPGQLAAALASRLGRPVAWRACGENGITAGEARKRLLPQVAEEPVDLVLLVFGVNDTTHFSSSRSWLASQQALARHFVERGAQVAFAGVPPLQYFSALPWLLRHLLGWRARLLDWQLRALAMREGLACCATRLEMRPDYLALDGYHPSSLGYRVWGESLADWMVGRVGEGGEIPGPPRRLAQVAARPLA